MQQSWSESKLVNVFHSFIGLKLAKSKFSSCLTRTRCRVCFFLLLISHFTGKCLLFLPHSHDQLIQSNTLIFWGKRSTRAIRGQIQMKQTHAGSRGSCLHVAKLKPWSECTVPLRLQILFENKIIHWNFSSQNLKRILFYY